MSEAIGQQLAESEIERPKWGEIPGSDRRAELQELFTQQQELVEQKKFDITQSVFKGMELTGADVFWLAVLALPGTHGNYEKSAKRLGKKEGDLDLSGLHLEGANLSRARLVGADLGRAHLNGANLSRAHLEGANLSLADLENTNLRRASFNKASRLNGAALDGASFDQVIFDNTNLAVVPWEKVRRFGDERRARSANGVKRKSDGYHRAARAYLSLSVALRNQGLGADSTRFHYRSELMERRSSFWQIFVRLFSWRFYSAPVAFGRWLVSWLLGTFAGYGDDFRRLLLTYVLVVSAFAGLMFLAGGRVVSFDAIRDVFVLSITSFHGRGVQPPGLTMTDTLATLTAVEAIFGLFIEGIFIAAFTRRVTGS